MDGVAVDVYDPVADVQRHQVWIFIQSREKRKCELENIEAKAGDDYLELLLPPPAQQKSAKVGSIMEQKYLPQRP